MRRPGVASLVLVAASALVAPAAAQVTTNAGALSGLAPAAHPAHGTGNHGSSHPAHRGGTAQRRTAHPAPAHHAAGPAGSRVAIPAPHMPLHPPPPPVIAPPALHVPLHPPPPPPPVPVDPHAGGTARTGPNGVVTLDFAPDGVGLNAAMMSAVQATALDARADPDRIVLIDSYAPGSADDPSSPRRLSLRRALAIRAVMINGGIPSTRVFARALGMPEPATGAASADAAGSPAGTAGANAGDANRTVIAVRDQRGAGAFAPVAAP